MSGPPDAAELARLTVDVLEAIGDERPIPAAASAWLRSGMIALLTGVDIRAALGLRQGHGKRAEKAVALAHRNAAVLRISGEHSGVPLTARAQLVADQLKDELASAPGSAKPDLAIVGAREIGLRQVLRIIGERPAPVDVATLNDLSRLWSRRA